MGRDSSRSGETGDAEAGSTAETTETAQAAVSMGPSESLLEQVGASGASDSPGPDVRGQASPAQYEAYYGVEIDAPGEVDRLQRLEESNTLQQVREWADEGMPVAAMGEIPQMEAFRERKGTPVPWDAERRNEESKRRNTSPIQRATEGSPAGETDTPESVREVLSSPGQSLDASIQRAMEDHMGDSLGDVRIHTGPKAAKACEEINAKAFTVGNHVAFNHGEYDPESPEGQHVLAHELAHVRQQTGGTLSMLPQEDVDLEIDPDPALEREAEETAEQIVQSGHVDGHQVPGSDFHVQRWGGSTTKGRGSPDRQTMGLHRLPKDDSVEGATEDVEDATSWIVARTALSRSSADVMVSETTNPEEVARFRETVTELQRTAKIDELPEKRKRQVARNLMGKDPLGANATDTEGAGGETMTGIRRDVNAVFGYAPSDDDEVPDFGLEWGDPDQVMSIREQRKSYVETQAQKLASLEDRVESLRSAGMSLEEIATQIVLERNVDRILEYVADGDTEAIRSVVARDEGKGAAELWEAIQPFVDESERDGLLAMFRRNDRKYERAAGPTAQELRIEKDSWHSVLFGSYETNPAVDVLVGLRDIQE